MSSEVLLPKEVIVAAIRIVYEASCPMLSIDKPFSKGNKKQPIDFYTKKVWSSRKRDKIYAQKLVTLDELIAQVQEFLPETDTKTIVLTISDMVDMEVFWLIDVDTYGSNVKKIFLAPLGLALLQSIDQGALFNSRQVSHQYIREILTKDLLLEVLKAERLAWLGLIQKKVAAPQARVNSQAVCLGLYLLSNGAIAYDHALHLTLTNKKDFKHHEVLTEGLEFIAHTIFRDSLFTSASLKDDLQRRSELIQNVGPSFKWQKPKKKEQDEHYWWELEDYDQDPSSLEYIVRCLVYSIPIHKDIETLESDLKKVTDYFFNKVDNQLSPLRMLELFPNPPAQDFEFALQAAIDKAMEEIAMDYTAQEDDKANKRRKNGTRRGSNATA